MTEKENILTGENIICLSSVPWDYLKISNQQTMARLARQNRVLFIERNMSMAAWLHDREDARKYHARRRKNRLRKETDSLFVFTPPFALPYAARSVTVNRLNMFLTRISLRPVLKKLNFKNPIFYSYLPQGHFLEGKLFEKLVCYEVIDEYSAFPHVTARLAAALEKKMLAKADLVFAISPNLYNNRVGKNPATHLVPIGAETEHFSRSRDPDLEMPEELAGLSSPIIGYFGGIDSRFDADLYRRLAKNFPAAAFLIIGPVKEREIRMSLEEFDNVHFLGSRDYALLPRYLKYFDVATLPYLITPFTENIFPNKIFEYLSSGKPVVTTAVPSIEYLKESGAVYWTTTADEFEEGLRRALAEKGNEELIRKRIAIAEDNTWDSRSEKISALIARRLRE